MVDIRIFGMDTRGSFRWCFHFLFLSINLVLHMMPKRSRNSKRNQMVQDHTSRSPCSGGPAFLLVYSKRLIRDSGSWETRSSQCGALLQLLNGGVLCCVYCHRGKW